ncbi:Crp/Fnr family transcriptional regulator [Aquimarina aggregata]|uniref:Crp/Fnr family transcriptional regulator n=1 Tax=Aquimarina aggregata TaxID=1642818 RepID=UPI002490288E|nr:cyclic nucleotide-binding domain-containing protein [Aquimarina aggregata]
MQYPQLYKQFKKHIDLPLVAYLNLEERLIIKKINKKEHFIEEGKIARYLPFIQKGLLVNYRVDTAARTHVIQIGYTGTWLGDLFSFFNGSPTHFNIQAFQETDLLLINRETYDYISKKYPIYEKYYRIGIQNSYNQMLKRIYNINSQSAQKRYHDLIESVPTILDDIPHYMIASYLGIKPQSLSRIRNQ